MATCKAMIYRPMGRGKALAGLLRDLQFPLPGLGEQVSALPRNGSGSAAHPYTVTLQLPPKADTCGTLSPLGDASPWKTPGGVTANASSHPYKAGISPGVSV